MILFLEILFIKYASFMKYWDFAMLFDFLITVQLDFQNIL